MNARKIINTVALVCMIIAIVAGFAESNNTDDFISGVLIGICFAFMFVNWWWDL